MFCPNSVRNRFSFATINFRVRFVVDQIGVCRMISFYSSVRFTESKKTVVLNKYQKKKKKSDYYYYYVTRNVVIFVMIFNRNPIKHESYSYNLVTINIVGIKFKKKYEFFCFFRFCQSTRYCRTVEICARIYLYV